METKTLDPREVGDRLKVWFERKVSKADIQNIVRRPEGFSAEIFTFSAKWVEGEKEISRELVLNSLIQRILPSTRLFQVTSISMSR